MKKTIFFAAAILALSACSSSPKTEEKKAEPAPATETKTETKHHEKPATEAATESVEKPAAADVETEGESAEYSEVTTTTTVNEAAATPVETVEVYEPILPTELGRFEEQDYDEYEETHGVQTFYQPSDEEIAPVAVEVETFKVENGVSTFVSAASNRRFVTDASAEGFENGLYETSKRCHLRAAPSKQSEILGVVPVGKLVWADDSSDRWARVYRDKGPAYLHKGCL